jgi:hypothetical protein
MDDPFKGKSTDVIHTGVDLECLSIFEQRLFEMSPSQALQEITNGA